MRTLAIGDIHGCSAALEVLLKMVQPAPEDLIVTLGDYVDRGPDSAGVIQRLIALRRTCRVVSLLGNHEQMMLRAREGRDVKDWLGEGGKQTLRSYSVLGDEGKLVDVPDEHWDFLESVCVRWHEIETHFFVHANAYPDMPLDEQPDFMLLWETLDPRQPPHESGKVLVCGHWGQKSGWPLNVGHAICIDTRAYAGGWLTCLDVKTSRVWQASQKGEQRTGWLDDGPPASGG